MFITVTIIIAIIIIMGTLAYAFPMCKIEGRSMFPTLRDGSYVLATRLFNYKTLKVGDICIFTRIDAETKETRYVVKRIAKFNPLAKELVYFLGDNADESYDSRNYGYVNVANIKFKLIKQIRR